MTDTDQALAVLTRYRGIVMTPGQLTLRDRDAALHLIALAEAGVRLATFTGHNPYCALIAEQIQCDQTRAIKPPRKTRCRIPHGPCDCGYAAVEAAMRALTG